MKFIGVIQNPPLVTCFDKARFYRKLVTSCLELECFHFSMQGEHMDPPEARILTNTFFPGTQFNKSIATNGGSQCKVMEDKQASRPTLSTMSITDSDVRNENVLHLFKPFMDPFYNKILTTLEIVPAVGTSSHHIGHIFHNFLCSASTLQHLIAPMIPYDAEYLDLGSTVPGEEGYYSPRSCRTGQRISENARIKRQIWACHGLLTLKIQFKSMTVDSPMAENARIMFGYISRACPKLKVLSIYRQVLDLRLDGGFCLLTRLRYLKTLTIETGTNIVLKARDVEWMARYPKKSKLSWLSSSRSGTGNSPTSSSTGINTTSGISRTNSTRSKSSTKSSYYGSETKEDVSLEPTLDDFKELGLITDVEACRRQILMAQSEQDCWTRLEFLGIKVGKLKSEREDNLDSLIESLRPDIEFSRDPRHW
ncbi:hypothetical protein BGZ46_004094 [Entomortierella lignicola]|nr:hypothetical protein BGZ46_004094 [Entomortierella lignicola]